ncbi:aminotransferase class I/II-fold pyridoxal phosphate-dependent enzyme [Phormidium tenue FACHB-886]|nr:aminotransferase class I/II-fold pyridoxal phosphate-dependent enzyme [Phormidium tenue FACHB-886]
MTSQPQDQAPLLEALRSAAWRSTAAFHTPGHKGGQGIPSALADLLGSKVFPADLPELPELDNLFTPEGVILKAQALAAAAFGAEQTWFLANGSTCGIQAAVLATCQPGEKLILPRNVHQSAIAALILSGAVPVWLEPEVDPLWGIAHSVDPASIATALAQHPDAKAILLVSPTYYGVCGNVVAIAQLAHAHGIPLLVDEAHGAHFAFHADLPLSALKAGADLTVQSTHKTLSALTQAAMLHVQHQRIDRDRLSRALQIVQSTSPSYLLLASLDAARQQMATQGESLMAQALALAASIRAQLAPLPIAVLSSSRSPSPGFFALDPLRLTLSITGLSGFQADERLHQEFGVTCELPGLHHLTFILTHGNTPEEADRLVISLEKLSRTPPAFSSSLPPADCLTPPARVPSLSPRQAFFAAHATVPVQEAIAQPSAELICPYPPGIPVLIPGEIITPEAICSLQQTLLAGGILTGCADSTLQTLKIVSCENT